MTLTSCQSCGSKQPQWTLKYASHDVYSCSACDGYSFGGKVSQSAGDLYSDSYFNEGEYLSYEAHDNVHRLNFKRKLNILQQFTVKPTVLLELGCAYGYFLETAKAQGITNVYGVDVSPGVVGKAAQRVGSLHVGMATEMKKIPVGTNTIVAWDVWEHLESPHDLFSQYVNQLPKGGVLAITTVDSGAWAAHARGEHWRQIHPPTHLHYPNRKSLDMSFTSMGLNVVYHKSFGYYRAAETYAAALGVQKFMPQSLRKVPVYLNLFDIQFIIGQKN